MGNLCSKKAQHIMWDSCKLSALPLGLLAAIINLAKQYWNSSSLSTRNATIIICSFLAIYLGFFGVMIVWKIRQNIRDRKDKKDNRTDEIALRAETRQLRANEANGRADVFKAAKKFNENGVSFNQEQMTKFETFVANVINEKDRTSQVLDQMDDLNETINQNPKVARDSTFETKIANRDQLNYSAVSKSAKRPMQPFFSLSL